MGNSDNQHFTSKKCLRAATTDCNSTTTGTTTLPRSMSTGQATLLSYGGTQPALYFEERMRKAAAATDRKSTATAMLPDDNLCIRGIIEQLAERPGMREFDDFSTHMSRAIAGSRELAESGNVLPPNTNKPKSPRLSELMAQSVENGGFWGFLAATYSFAFDDIYR
ncbi:hypothetical protein FQN50_000203 [Emmonsiellopsis sp. PD_5]|nr:hypothetical protein FQN50_000203 [Emmonsiellopsis sp. PD_5]